MQINVQMKYMNKWIVSAIILRIVQWVIMDILIFAEITTCSAEIYLYLLSTTSPGICTYELCPNLDDSYD